MAKFGSLEEIRVRRTPEAPAPPEAPEAPAPRASGRPPGKRSDAAMEPANLILGKQTKFEVKQLLERRRIAGHGRRDLSMLVEELLRAWVAENANA